MRRFGLAITRFACLRESSRSCFAVEICRLCRITSKVMSALETVLKEGRYKLPLPVKAVSGTGLKALKAGLDLVRNGVSRFKIVVRI